MEKLIFLNIFKTLSKIVKIILRIKVKTPVQTDEGIKSYHQKTCQLCRNICLLKSNFAKLNSFKWKSEGIKDKKIAICQFQKGA